MLLVSNLKILLLQKGSVENFTDFGSAGADPANYSMNFLIFPYRKTAVKFRWGLQEHQIAIPYAETNDRKVLRKLCRAIVLEIAWESMIFVSAFCRKPFANSDSC